MEPVRHHINNQNPKESKPFRTYFSFVGEVLLFRHAVLFRKLL